MAAPRACSRNKMRMLPRPTLLGAEDEGPLQALMARQGRKGDDGGLVRICDSIHLELAGHDPL
jgi:hypothetical protein